MKNIILLVALCMISVATTVQSQEKVATAEDFERWVEGDFQVKFRTNVIEAMELEAKDIEKFDELYADYMRKQGELSQEKKELVDAYQAEMKEDDSEEDEAEETAEFIEDFWEIDIAHAELKKDYFDKFEDVVGWSNAFNFFQYESALRTHMENRIAYRVVPLIIDFDHLGYDRYSKEAQSSMKHDKDKEWKDSEKYAKADAKDKMHTEKTADMKKDRVEKMDKEKEAYKQNKKDKYADKDGAENLDSWIKNHGKVSLDHSYTYNGIKHTVNALKELDADNQYQDTYASIMEDAEFLTRDQMSNEHADRAHQAFTAIVNNIKTMCKAANISDTELVEMSEKAAQKIDVDQPLSTQGEHIHSFFNKTHKAIKALQKQSSSID